MEAFILHHLAIVPQESHAGFQVLSAVNVFGHDVVVGPVEKDLPQELDALPLRHV